MGVHKKEVYAEVKRLLEIPEDEPIFILRGQDRLAIETLEQYEELAISDVPSKEFRSGVSQCLLEFDKFANDNPRRMKIPD